MKSADFIQRKFQAWAQRKNIALQGSAGDRGEPNYTLSLQANLFGGKLHPQVRTAFEAGRGGELRGKICSMQALHSSAAMTVNLFQHWVVSQQFQTLAEILDVPSKGIESVEFERKYPVCDNGETFGLKDPPHLDLGIDYNNGERVGVECKLSEPYGRLDHPLLRTSYLDLVDAWNEIPACRALAKELVTGDADFKRLDAAQLLRHILGMKFGKTTKKVRLIYLYFDTIGEDAAEHRAEIRRFQGLLARDPIRFVPMTVQELILRAVGNCRIEHPAYVDYIAERYL